MGLVVLLEELLPPYANSSKLYARGEFDRLSDHKERIQ